MTARVGKSTAAIATGGLAVDDAKVLSTAHADATGIASSASALGAPAIAQKHILTATGISPASSVLGAAPFEEIHALFAASVRTDNPTFIGPPPELLPISAEVYALYASGIGSLAAALASPAILQKHALAAIDIASQASSLGRPPLPSAARVLFRGNHSSVSAGVASKVSVSASISAPSSTVYSNLPAADQTAAGPNAADIAAWDDYRRIVPEAERNAHGLI
jgi:hypothetical protein